MVAHAKYFNTFLISGNAKFYLEDIPRGFVCYNERGVDKFAPRTKCIMKVFHLEKLGKLLGLDASPNPHALSMWRTVLYHRDTFKNFTESFFGKSATRPDFYPTSKPFWMQSLLTDRCRKVSHLKLLQFFLEKSSADATKVICSQLYLAERKEAALLFEQEIAARSIEPHNVFERIKSQIECGDYSDEDLPQWFLRYLTVECKVIPGLMDFMTDRRHYLMTLPEDFDRESVNESTVRLRRIIYGILFSESKTGHEAVLITELDRKGDKLQERKQTPIWKLWDPDAHREPFDVPGLKKVELLSEAERIKLFLSSMGVSGELRRQTDSGEVLYVLSVLRYWTLAAEGIRKVDLWRVLLTALMVRERYSRPSNIFKKYPVRSNEAALEGLGIDFDPRTVPNFPGSFARMHPLSQLQNVTFFARILHRLLMQPLGPSSDCIETFTSESAFYHICQLTDKMKEEELESFVLDLVEKNSRDNFVRTVDLIWDSEARDLGRIIVSGFRGDDERA
ncbi:uncharacterized protein LOC100899378 [Galendromus occidentalis]|uniref:Uncharacterized protein LOC100899378 n=1 Tax=Galendromus occidentalis TaxID=34638 RepID=A0AAJ7L793_9ACAR|nr:uncharacterized protein LOC100899378 [Galendromus occidentalis]